MDPIQCAAFVQKYKRITPDESQEYLRMHERRLISTLVAIPDAAHTGARAIEFNTYGFFPLAMSDVGGYSMVDGTTWGKSPYKISSKNFCGDLPQRIFRIFDVNPEKEMLPIEGSFYDFILCADVIERFSVDPMAAFWEMNRITNTGGAIFIVTPNAACINNVARVLGGTIASPYYRYRKNVLILDVIWSIARIFYRLHSRPQGSWSTVYGPSSVGVSRNQSY